MSACPACRASLLDKVKEDPPNRATLGIGKPGSLRKRNAAAQIVNVLNHDIRMRARFPVLLEDVSQRFILAEGKTCHVVFEGPTT